MMPDLTLSSNEVVLFHASPLRKFKGARLPGSEYWLAEREDLTAHFQQYYQDSYSICYRILKTASETCEVIIKETGRLRIEAVLEGNLVIRDGSHQHTIEKGQYHIVSGTVSELILRGNQPLIYLVAGISGDVIDLQLPGPGRLLSLSKQMSDLITELLFNRYQSSLLPFYYENCIRELFFLHAAQQTGSPDIKLSDQELTAVHEADKIIRENLHLHFSIQELAKKTGTNEFKLKKDFRTVFNTGLFGRLLQLRMEYAKHLLKATSLSIKDISEKTGYDTVAGFITAFKKYYGSPPGEWRDNKDQMS
ncbi:MAG: hypothetical protein DI535_02595 [Citrobacter freundii]|nr:MAG: hypothetical protein DI535_02595 [Citrobacter freundii]